MIRPVTVAAAVYARAHELFGEVRSAAGEPSASGVVEVTDFGDDPDYWSIIDADPE